jgi:hypothetical protein
MRVSRCYHRMRIRVKLTCDEMPGSVGARDQRRPLRRLTVRDLSSSARTLPPTLVSGKPLVCLSK